PYFLKGFQSCRCDGATESQSRRVEQDFLGQTFSSRDFGGNRLGHRAATSVSGAHKEDAPRLCRTRHPFTLGKGSFCSFIECRSVATLDRSLSTRIDRGPSEGPPRFPP